MGGSGEKERKAKRTFTGQSWSPPEFISLAFSTDLLGPVPAADDNGSTRASVFSPSPRASCDSSLSRREDLKGCFQSMLGRREQSLRKTAALRLSFQNFPTFRRGWEDTGFSWGDFTCPSGGRPAPFPLGKSKWTAKALLLTPRVTGPCASPCHRRGSGKGTSVCPRLRKSQEPPLARLSALRGRLGPGSTALLGHAAQTEQVARDWGRCGSPVNCSLWTRLH